MQGETDAKSLGRNSIVVVTSTSVFVLALIVAVTFYAMRNGDGNEHADKATFCDNLIDRQLVSSYLVEGEVSDVNDRIHGSITSGGFRCVIEGLSDNSESRITIALDKHLSPWPYADRGNWNGYSDHSPLGGGLDGWVNNNDGAIRLPKKCDVKVGSADEPAKVAIRLSGDASADEVTDLSDRRVNLRSLLMGVSRSVAEKIGCSTEDFKAPEDPVAVPEKLPVTPSRTCGLENFRPIAEDREMRELQAYVVSDSDYAWSCAIALKSSNESDSKSAEIASFTVTRLSQLVEEYESSGRANLPVYPGWSVPGHVPTTGSVAVLNECSGEKHLIRMNKYSSASQPKYIQEAAKRWLKPDQEVFEEFVKAVGAEYSCNEFTP